MPNCRGANKIHQGINYQDFLQWTSVGSSKKYPYNLRDDHTFRTCDIKTAQCRTETL